MTYGSRVRNLVRVRCRCHGTHSQTVRQGWRMAMANNSANSGGSSTMSDVYKVLFTFLTHFWLFVK